MRQETKLAWNFGVDGFLFLGLTTNVSVIFAAASGALGRSDPFWFLGLAVAWPFACGFCVSLIWVHSLSFKFSCIQTAVILVVAAIAIWLNLRTVLQIMYVA